MSSKIKFICNLEGCENEHSLSPSAYQKNTNHYCSQECYYKAQRTQTYSHVDCSIEDCNETVKVTAYRLKHNKNIFCSQKCYLKHRKDERNRLLYHDEPDPNLRITFTCDNEGCIKEKTVLLSKYKLSKNHFCSQECAGKRKGLVIRTYKMKDVMAD